MRFSQWIGIAAAIVLIGSGFMNWTWYPDIGKHFTGYYSHENIYGKPGKFLALLAIIAIVFFLIRRLWAKRWNILFCATAFAFAVKTFILYTSCYKGICPVRQPGIWVMLGSAVVMFLCSLLPDLKVNKKANDNH